jgi:4-methylaminobutanoate oxidase (formaldehyde-forming)
VSFVVDDPAVMMWGGELLLRDGVGTGQVTSAAFGTATGSCVGLAYVWRPDGGVVTPEYLAEGEWQVNVGGTRVGASVSLKAPYDPTSERIRT